MTHLKNAETIDIPAWIGGLEKNTPPALNEPGTLADGQNFVPTQASRLATRGGSRIVNTLHNDAGSPTEMSNLNGIWPWTSIGAICLGTDTAQHKSYAWYLTQDAAFKGASEAQSRVDLSLSPTGHILSAPWTDANNGPIPQVTELFEGIYLCDATLASANRRWFLSLNQTVPVVQIGSPSPNAKVPRFAFAGSGDSGTATSGTATTLVDTTKVWKVGQFNSFSVTIVGGTGKGEVAIVTSVTAPSTLNVASWSIATPDTTSQYVITPGIAQEITPYCVETYNNVLFIAGYGSEAAGDADRPELVRHSFLGIAPSNSLALGDISDGFDKNAFNLLGAKGQRVTAMKQGRGVLLAAKANELYRISGAGRAYPGWQYATEMLMNTSGFGVSNPNALCFAEGFWYGIGAAGMFRTDGFLHVEAMTGPRKADFLGLDNLANSFCFYHPDRRLILFGVHPQGTTPATYPYLLWSWDVERQRWQPDGIFATPTAWFHGNAIATTSVNGPAAPPSAPVSSAITTSGYTAAWTNGDATAQTEVWQLDLTLTWVLNSTQSAGINTVAITGDQDHSAYQWKVRHTKNGLPSAYTTPQVVDILMVVPIVSIVTINGIKKVIVGEQTHTGSSPVGGNVTITLQQSPTGAGTWTTIMTWANQSFGNAPSVVVTGTFDYRAKVTDSAWTPADSAWSTTVNG